MITVGIDFDNTLIDYDCLFAIAGCDLGWVVESELTKAEVKSKLLDEDGNDLRWQQLQTTVYSQYIEQAKPYAGVKEFCEKVIANGDKILIVSHKTRLSNYDGKTDLIAPAKRWLLKQGFIGDKGLLVDDDVYFLETLEQKVQTISKLRIDLFIDDLSKVLLDRFFPESTVAILFSSVDQPPLISSDSWGEISVFYEVCKMLGMPVAEKLASQYKTLPCAVLKLKTGGNNNLLKIDWRHETVVAKISRNIPALRNEYDALVLMEKVANVPKALLLDESSGVLLESALSGKSILIPNERHISGAVDFLIVLDQFGRREVPYRMASHFRGTLGSYLENVENRLSIIKQHLPSLQEFDLLHSGKAVIDKLERIWKIIKCRFFEKAAGVELSLSEKFPAEEMILSPSDYGFHNMLETEKSAIQVCDFEYFGWDDKAKLAADFFHHQGHSLTDRQRLLFIRQAFDKKLINSRVVQRMELILDVIGIEWVLILLNIFDPERLNKKLQAGANTLVSPASLINSQISKATALLENYLQRSESHPLFITSAISTEQWASCYV